APLTILILPSSLIKSLKSSFVLYRYAWSVMEAFLFVFDIFLYISITASVLSVPSALIITSILFFSASLHNEVKLNRHKSLEIDNPIWERSREIVEFRFWFLISLAILINSLVASFASFSVYVLSPIYSMEHLNPSLL